MKAYWLKLALLSTFVFWASGAAKYTHEALEHHGKDASVDDDDDDALTAPGIAASLNAKTAPPQSIPPVKQHCPICQMLAAMAVDRSAPPALPSQGTLFINTLVLVDLDSPAIHACFNLTARGPPPV